MDLQKLMRAFFNFFFANCLNPLLKLKNDKHFQLDQSNKGHSKRSRSTWSTLPS